MKYPTKRSGRLQCKLRFLSSSFTVRPGLTLSEMPWYSTASFLVCSSYLAHYTNSSSFEVRSNKQNSINSIVSNKRSNCIIFLLCYHNSRASSATIQRAEYLSAIQNFHFITHIFRCSWIIHCDQRDLFVSYLRCDLLGNIDVGWSRSLGQNRRRIQGLA